MLVAGSFAQDFHEHPFFPSAIKLVIEDMFPGPQVELALGNSYHDLPAHDLPFHVGIGIVFACTVVMVSLGGRIEWCERLKPDFVIVVQARFIVINKDRGGDMHGVDQDQTFLDATLLNKLLHFCVK